MPESRQRALTTGKPKPLDGFFSGSYFSPSKAITAGEKARQKTQPKVNAFAVVSTVCMALGFLTTIGFIPGAIFGFLALRQIKRSSEPQLGRTMALVSTCISCAPILLAILLLIAVPIFKITVPMFLD